MKTILLIALAFFVLTTPEVSLFESRSKELGNRSTI